MESQIKVNIFVKRQQLGGEVDTDEAHKLVEVTPHDFTLTQLEMTGGVRLQPLVLWNYHDIKIHHNQPAPLRMLASSLE